MSALNIGKKLKDFELMKLLGEGSSGKVIKVRSLINNEIYAMKIINLNIEEFEEYNKSELEMIKKLKNEYIVKYYTDFQDDNALYIIMEYLEYGTLDDYKNLLTFLQKKNPDVINNKKFEIINIFMQCISALKHLKESNIIHRDIKPENIFISQKGKIKLGDFGVSAKIDNQKDKTEFDIFKTNKFTIVGTKNYMAPEVYKGQEYNEKSDIYSMGLIFYEIYFLKNYRKETWINENDSFKSIFIKEPKPQNNKDPLIDFIYNMLEDDMNQRPDIDFLYEQINKIYIKFYSLGNNSGIYSVIRCLGHFPYVEKYFKEKYIIPKDKEKNFANYLYDCVVGENNNNLYLNEACVFFEKKFRENKYINNDNDYIDYHKEINPYIFLEFILDKIHSEFYQNIKESKNNLSKKENENNINIGKNEKFKKEFSEIFETIIGNNFSLIMKTFSQCKNCKNETKEYSHFFSLSFDLQKIKKINDNILNLIKCQNDMTLIEERICYKCKKETVFQEKKMFHYFPYCLIIYLDYNNNNSINIDYPENFELSSISKNLLDKSDKKYYLIGIIKNINGHFISMLYDYSCTNKWFVYDNNYKFMIQNYKEHNKGRVEILFYCSPHHKPQQPKN